MARAAGNSHAIVLVDEPLDAMQADAGAALAALDRHRTTTISAVRRVDDTTLQVRLLFRAAGRTWAVPLRGSTGATVTAMTPARGPRPQG